MLVEYAYGYMLDLPFHGSDYTAFGQCRADVDLSTGHIWEIYIRDMTIVDVNGDDCVRAYSEGEYRWNELKFIADTIRHWIYVQCSNDIVKNAREHFNYGT